MRNFNYKIFLVLAFVLFLTISKNALAASPDPLTGQDTIIGSYTVTGSPGSALFGRAYPSNDVLYIRYVSPNDHYICSVTFVFGKTGNPTDNVTVKFLKGTDYNSPTFEKNFANVLIGNLDIPAAGTPTTPWNFYFPNNNCYSMSGGQVAWFKVSRTGTQSSSNYYRLAHTGGSGGSFFPTSAVLFDYYGDVNGYAGSSFRVDTKVYGITNLNGFVSSPNQYAYSCQPTDFSFFDVDFGRNVCEALTYIFVPSPTFMDGFLNQVQEDMKLKIPFSYYYQVKEEVDSISTSTLTGNLVDTTISFSTPSAGEINIPFQAFNTTVGSPESQVFDVFRPYIEIFLWLSFSMYLLTRVFRFFKPI